MAKQKYIATVDGLIECLTDIKNACGGETPVQVNVIGAGCVTGLTSVCLDNDLFDEDGAIVYVETNPDEVYCPTTFNFYTQGREI